MFPWMYGFPMMQPTGPSNTNNTNMDYKVFRKMMRDWTRFQEEQDKKKAGEKKPDDKKEPKFKKMLSFFDYFIVLLAFGWIIGPIVLIAQISLAQHTMSFLQQVFK